MGIPQIDCKNTTKIQYQLNNKYLPQKKTSACDLKKPQKRQRKHPNHQKKVVKETLPFSDVVFFSEKSDKYLGIGVEWGKNILLQA